MLLSPLFMLLCSAALIIAVLSSLVSRGFGWRSCGGSTGLRLDLLVGSGSLTTYPTICGMCCTGFHSNSASLTGRGVQYVHWVMHKCIMVKEGGKRNTRKVCKSR